MPEIKETMTFERDELFTLLTKEIKDLNGSDLISFNFDVDKKIVCHIRDTKI